MENEDPICWVIFILFGKGRYQKEIKIYKKKFSSAEVCSLVIIETSFSYDKDISITATVIICAFTYCAFSIDTYSPINKFNSFIIFSLLINAVILLLNCLVLIFYLYIHFFSLRCYFPYLNIIWTFYD